MEKMRSLPLFLASLAVAALCTVPVSAVVAPSETAAAAGNKPFVTATVSAPSITPGTPLIVSGTAKGASEVQIWIFAGNFINVSSVSVKTDGTYARTYNTDRLPAATYYIFVQGPGGDNKLQIMSMGSSGQVTNMNTRAIIFNFTGMGSVQDNAAAVALSDALSLQGIDDVYAKTQFVITKPDAGTPPATTVMMPGSDRDAHGCIGSAGYAWCEAKQRCLREWEEPCRATAAPAPTKSTFVPELAVAALAFAGILSVVARKH